MKNKYSLIARLLGLLTAVILIVSVFTILNANIVDIPVVRVSLEQSGMDDISDEFEKIAEDMEKGLDDLTEEEEETIEEMEEIMGMEIEEVIALIENPSINGMEKVVNDLFQNSKFEEMADKLGISEDEMDLDVEMVNIFAIIKTIVIIAALFIFIFVVLGICFNKKVFPILAVVFSAAYFILLAGIGLYIAFVAIAIVQMVFMSMAKNEKKKLEQMQFMQQMQQQQMQQMQQQQMQQMQFMQQQQMDNNIQ